MLLLNVSYIGLIPTVSAAGNSTISIEPENTDITIGESVYIYLNASIDTDEPIGGYQVAYFNFTSGVINVTKVTKGNISDYYGTLFGKGTIQNSSGNVINTYELIGGVDSVDGNLSLCYYTVLGYGVGVSPLNFSAWISYSETSYSHTDTFGNITVHPTAVSGFSADTNSHNRINLTWTIPFGNGTDTCVIFANATGSAASRNPGDEIYNGTDDHYNHTGLSPDQTYNYSCWGWNETAGLYSLLFQQDSNTTDSAPGSGTWILLGDPTPASGSSYAYKTSQEVSIPIVGGYLTDINDQAITHGGYSGCTDELPHDYLYQLLNVTQGATEFTETVDYIVDEYDGTIDWSPAGAEPATGSTYYVNYTYIYDTSSAFTYWINTTAGQKTESGVSSGTKTYTMSGLTGGTEWWNVSASFDGNETHGNFTFSINRKPSGGGGGGSWNEDPPNSAPSISVSTALSVDVEDLDDDSVNVTFYWQNGTRIDNDTVVGSGTASVSPATLDYNTEYGWYVNATDGTDWTRGPTTGYWTFNTSTLGINLTKEWALNASNNTIRSWINVTNTGSTNFTNVIVWDRECAGLNLVSYNHTGDFAGNGHWQWTIPFLNISGYENHWYNITMLHEYYTTVPSTNGSEVWNYANVSHLGLTSSQNVSGYTVGFVVTKEANISLMNNSMLDVTWWINITNSGDFNLTNVTVNETYYGCINYTSSNIDPSDESNATFVIDYIKPGETFSLMVNVSATPDCISNGTRVFNNATVRCNELEEQTLSEYLNYGGITSHIRVTYDTAFTDVSVYGDTLVTIISVVLVLSAILLIVGLLKLGYFNKGEQ